MHVVHGKPLHLTGYHEENSIFRYKKSSLGKANSYTQRHKYTYLDFQLAVRVVSLTYISRKLDKVIFGTVTLPNPHPFSASFVRQVPTVAWQFLCNEHFLPFHCPIHGQQQQKGDKAWGQEGEGKYLI